MLLKDSGNGEQIVLKRKKGYIQENSVMEKKTESEIGENCQRCSIKIGGKCEEG